MNMLTVTNEAKQSSKSLKVPAWYLEVLGVRHLIRERVWAAK
ncbi:hypothetical protein [Bacillus subtilis]|nr:hypothetical protein [Bacillus subtilis]MEC2331767.1 hypothetical protein [Bacillus subtilis]